jgi:prepilin signal peptidase PulO-like enzyme (type II secretory pathway)
MPDGALSLSWGDVRSLPWRLLFGGLAGWLAGGAALWLDGRVELLLAEGPLAVWRATVTPTRRPRAAAPIQLLGGFSVMGVTPFLGAQAAALVVLPCTLVVCAWIDLRHRILPDAVVIPLALAGLVFAAFLPGVLPFRLAGLGGVVGLSLGLVIRFAERDKRVALGWGDVKLLTAIGAWVGPLGVAVVFVLAAAGMIPFLLWLRASSTPTLPFGPAIALATFAVLPVWLGSGQA